MTVASAVDVRLQCLAEAVRVYADAGDHEGRAALVLKAAQSFEMWVAGPAGAGPVVVTPRVTRSALHEFIRPVVGDAAADRLMAAFATPDGLAVLTGFVRYTAVMK